MKRIVVPFETKDMDGSTGVIEGLGSAFGNIDLGGDVVVRGAFSETLKRWRQKNQMPMMLWYHDMSMPVGEWEAMEETEEGLQARGFLWVPGNPQNRDPLEQSKQVRNLAVSNSPTGLSIGFRTIQEEFGEQEGRRVRFLKEVDLLELSIVPYGMNPKALVTSAKAIDLVDGDGQIVDPRTMEKCLRDAGLSHSQAKRFMAEGYKGLKPRDEVDDDLVAAIQNVTNLFNDLNKE